MVASVAGVDSAVGCGSGGELTTGIGSGTGSGKTWLLAFAPGQLPLSRKPRTIGLCSELFRAAKTAGGSAPHGPALVFACGASIQGLKRIEAAIYERFKT